ncbi:MAG: M48 family metallopeptidase [Bacteroidota bacterium]
MRKETISGLGTITFIKRRNNRRINVKIEPHSNIKVSLPQHIPYHTAKKFVMENRLLIQNKMESINGRLTLFESTSEFKTMWHTLRLHPGESSTSYYNIDNHFITVNYPHKLPVQHPEIQKTVRDAIEKTLRMEAKIYLPRRLHEFALKYKFNYNKVFVKNLKTLWGSCSHQNNINLNIHLMRLPRHLIDYIILHELTHTIIKNHSTSFQNLLNSIIDGNIEEMKHELHKYSPQIY